MTKAGRDEGDPDCKSDAVAEGKGEGGDEGVPASRAESRTPRGLAAGGAVCVVAVWLACFGILMTKKR